MVMTFTDAQTPVNTLPRGPNWPIGQTCPDSFQFLPAEALSRALRLRREIPSVLSRLIYGLRLPSTGDGDFQFRVRVSWCFRTAD
jgi:hypothetical protein